MSEETKLTDAEVDAMLAEQNWPPFDSPEWRDRVWAKFLARLKELDEPCEPLSGISNEDLRAIIDSPGHDGR